MNCLWRAHKKNRPKKKCEKYYFNGKISKSELESAIYDSSYNYRTNQKGGKGSWMSGGAGVALGLTLGQVIPQLFGLGKTAITKKTTDG